MAHGIEIYNQHGQLRVSLTSRITRLLFSRHISRGSSGSVTVPGFDPNKGVAMVIAKGVSNSSYGVVPHQVSVSGETVSWSPHSESDFADHHAGQLLVFAYA